ncbi:unnamed protein product [Durusdinium trenchii]|uniref:Uncharacterized protein n=1 Tax=Durusdinium trenchii TaxID=1381693 RepID=A0ABP0LI56_9DINO
MKHKFGACCRRLAPTSGVSFWTAPHSTATSGAGALCLAPPRPGAAADGGCGAQPGGEDASASGTCTTFGRTGVHGVCSHKSCGHIRYDARVSCFPFRLVTRMSSDLGWVLARLELLQAVQRRFRAAVAREAQGSAGSGSQHHGCWHSGAGSEAVRQKRWQCFQEALQSELDLETDAPLGGPMCPRTSCWAAGSPRRSSP